MAFKVPYSKVDVLMLMLTLTLWGMGVQSQRQEEYWPKKARRKAANTCTCMCVVAVPMKGRKTSSFCSNPALITALLIHFLSNILMPSLYLCYIWGKTYFTYLYPLFASHSRIFLLLSWSPLPGRDWRLHFDDPIFLHLGVQVYLTLNRHLY